MKVSKVKGIDTKEKVIETWNRGESPNSEDLMLIELPRHADKGGKWNNGIIDE